MACSRLALLPKLLCLEELPADFYGIVILFYFGAEVKIREISQVAFLAIPVQLSMG